MNFVKIFIAASGLLTALPSMAGQYTDALGTCLADNTNGKERKELAQWIFVAISAHPEIKDLSNVTTKIRNQSNQKMGILVTRLLSEDCALQTRAALKNEGSESLKTSFETLGKLAMQELMSNSAVSESIAGYAKYIDEKKLASVLAPQ